MIRFRVVTRRLLVIIGACVLNVAPPGCTDWANVFGGAHLPVGDAVVRTLAG